MEPFGVLHLITVATVAAAIVAMVWTGRRLRGTAAGRKYEMGLSLALWVILIGYLTYDFVKLGWNPKYTLPLQLCDVVAVIVALVFARPTRRLQALAYFWGLALSTQAFITPDVAGGPESLSFWAFWLYHLFVVGAGIYVVVVQRFRPGWSDLHFALVAGIAYVAVIFTIDAIFGVNYGYLGRATPGIPTLIDVLGRWPWRVVVMVLLASVAMTLLLVPWLFQKQSDVRGQSS